MNKPINDSFFKYVRSFLTVYLPRNKCYSANTVKAYRDTINLLRIFLSEQKKIPFTRITFSIINHTLVYEFLEWLQSSRNCIVSTRNQRLAALKSFLHYCANEEPAIAAVYMDVQDITALRDTKKGVSYMSPNALKAVLKQPDTRNRLDLRNRFFMIIMYDTGGRIQEILDLKLRDICLDSVFIKKYAEQARVFCPEVPEKVHAHLFRHSRAMHLYQSGVPLSYIKDFLGHVSADTTSIYASADTTMIRDALEKAARMENSSYAETPVWEDNEDMILKLCGLK